MCALHEFVDNFFLKKVSTKIKILAWSENYRYHEKGKLNHLTPQSLTGDEVPAASVHFLKKKKKKAYIARRPNKRYST